MESKQIKDILVQLNGNNAYRKIFINGTWGIGKSYYTNEYIKENDESIIYISLFGKSSFESILDSLSNELLKNLNKRKQIKKKLKKIVKNIQGSISFYGISISSPVINNKSLFEEYNNILEEKKLIIIIDDLERKSKNVAMEDIMGLIEQLSLLEKTKIVIIGDETNIDDNDREMWNKFKEKTIEKEYIISNYSHESIESIVINELKQYINKEQLIKFVSGFLIQHKISNLRTIKKAINLFIEIYENYLYETYNQDIYLSILKSCMSVVIEYTEELYKPKESDEKRTFQYYIDKEIPTRIISHYFTSLFIYGKDSEILNYVISIYNCNITDDLIKEFNTMLKNKISRKDEKNIFYFSEEEIKNKVNDIYNKMIEKKYIFSTLKEFISDMRELVKWNKIFSMKINEKEISKIFNEILFSNYYSLEKNIYNNKIDLFYYDKEEIKDLEKMIESYNNLVEEKYIEDKINKLERNYKNNIFDVKILDWFKNNFSIEESEIKEKFVKCCKQNNYLLPDLNDEIDENLWHWTHCIWGIFYTYIDEKHKKELNSYVENKKKSSNLAKYRIECLQKIKPLE